MDHIFNDVRSIQAAGFIGFKTIEELFNDSSDIPHIKGIYLIINPNYSTPKFLSIGSGGYFKGKNPNVSLENLKAHWVDDSMIVYIGKAGGEGKKATLFSRLKQYFQFGQGRNVGHWGGRLIWQLEYYKELIVCWKPLPDEEPRLVESLYLKRFIKEYSKLPFANLVN